jgi:hypothetical protein
MRRTGWCSVLIPALATRTKPQQTEICMVSSGVGPLPGLDRGGRSSAKFTHGGNDGR